MEINLFIEDFFNNYNNLFFIFCFIKIIKYFIKEIKLNIYLQIFYS